MIIALLVLIAFVLLFGAGVVKGWLANAAALGGGCIVLLGLVLWAGSFLGADGPIYLVMGGMGLLLILSIWLKATEPTKPAAKPVQRFHSHAPSREERKRMRGR